MQKVIAITGIKGSGKDTIASIICEADSSFTTIAFADKVKDICAVMFDWDRDMLSGRFPESREWREQPDPFWSSEFGFDFTPRKALTTIGTDLIRDTFLAHIWDIIVKKQILMNPDCSFVITDCRFPNELEMLRELGATIVEVRRGELPDWYYTAQRYNNSLAVTKDELTELFKNHPSERDWIGLNNPAHIFYNNGTIENLKKEVLEWLH